MNTDPETLFTRCEFDDDQTGMSVVVESIQALAYKTVVRYYILLLGEQVGFAIFEYLPECDTVLFVTVELDEEAQNQGFTTRWLNHNERVFAESELRRCSVTPVGFAENIFGTAGWQPNTEDELGSHSTYYTLEP